MVSKTSSQNLSETNKGYIRDQLQSLLYLRLKENYRHETFSKSDIKRLCELLVIKHRQFCQDNAEIP